MDNIPKELEETQLNLQVVVDPETKCITMKTHTEDIPTNFDTIPAEIAPRDPLHQNGTDEVDLEKMSELNRLIYSERLRLLNLRMPTKKVRMRNGDYFADIIETDTYQQLSQNEKSKLRMRKFRERESHEEREHRRFRHRITTMKIRLMQKLKNFEDETFLKEITKRNTDRIKQKRMELKANETPEQRRLRKSQINTKSRLAKLRRKAFKTPEELIADKEKRLAYLEKFWSRHTEEQRKAKQKVVKEKAKERLRQNKREWKKVEMMIKGTPVVDDLVVESEAVDKI